MDYVHLEFEVAEEVSSAMDQNLLTFIDDILPDDFEMYELEGDESVYFNYVGRSDEATAELRRSSPREEGYTEEIGPQFVLLIVTDGPTPDHKTTWFSVEAAVEYATQHIKTVLRVSQED